MDRIELGVPDGKQEQQSRPAALLCLCCVGLCSLAVGGLGCAVAQAA